MSEAENLFGAEHVRRYREAYDEYQQKTDRELPVVVLERS